MAKLRNTLGVTEEYVISIECLYRATLIVTFRTTLVRKYMVCRSWPAQAIFLDYEEGTVARTRYRSGRVGDGARAFRSPTTGCSPRLVQGVYPGTDCREDPWCDGRIGATALHPLSAPAAGDDFPQRIVQVLETRADLDPTLAPDGPRRPCLEGASASKPSPILTQAGNRCPPRRSIRSLMPLSVSSAMRRVSACQGALGAFRSPAAGGQRRTRQEKRALRTGPAAAVRPAAHAQR